MLLIYFLPFGVSCTGFMVIFLVINVCDYCPQVLLSNGEDPEFALPLEFHGGNHGTDARWEADLDRAYRNS